MKKPVIVIGSGLVGVWVAALLQKLSETPRALGLDDLVGFASLVALLFGTGWLVLEVIRR
jgi:hypothetical protein